MEAILDTIDRLAATLTKMQPLKPEYQQRLDKKFRLEFNYNSNHIEGNTLTYGETELLLIFGKTTGNHELREYEEMKSHDVAFELIKDWAKDKERPLTEMAIKNVHEMLLVRPFWKEALTVDGQPTRRLIKVGNYKEQPNSVRLQNGEMFHYTSPENTPIEMGELMSWYKDEEQKSELHPVTLAALLHYKFVRIHSFDDGNGRISRLLMNYILLKNGLHPVVIKSSDKKNYLFALNQADVGNMDVFVDYIAEQVIWSLDISIKAAKGEKIDEPEDFDKKMLLLKRKLGETPDVKVEMKYGKDAIEKVVSDSLIPLIDEWEKNLKDFEPLFLSRRVSFVFDHSEIGGNSFGENFNIKLKNYLKNDITAIMKNRQLLIKNSFKGLRNIDNGVSMNAGEIKINFYDNAYEITWLSAKPINKLYHQKLTENEINTIASDLGNWFHNNVEEYIEKNKK